MFGNDTGFFGATNGGLIRAGVSGTRPDLNQLSLRVPQGGKEAAGTEGRNL